MAQPSPAEEEDAPIAASTDDHQEMLGYLNDDEGKEDRTPPYPGEAEGGEEAIEEEG